MPKPLTPLLTSCACCPRACGVNRLDGQLGFCGVGIESPVANTCLHFGEEPPISGTRGSGTIFFAGCNLRCVFCQNHQISQDWRQSRVGMLSIDGLAEEMLRLQDMGAHNINFVSPSHMGYQMADAIVAAKGRGLAVPVVYNSNGYDSVDALRRIRGLVDIYLPDIKYMDNALGKRFSAADDYVEAVTGALPEMLDQVGHLELDDDGIAVRGLLVRHLVLPGQLTSSRKCLDFLAGLSPDTHVSIMSQYSPQYRAFDYPEISARLTPDEYDQIVEYALDLGLENAFIQEMESQESCLPDFEKDKPFDFE